MDERTAAQLEGLAAQQDCTVDEMVEDMSRAVRRYRVVDGRRVVNMERGVPALCDKVNAWLCAHAGSRSTSHAKPGSTPATDREAVHRLARALCVVVGQRLPPNVSTLAGVIEHLSVVTVAGKAKTLVPLILERWDSVERAARNTE